MKRIVISIITLFCMISLVARGHETVPYSLVLINKDNKLSEDYAPDDLKDVSQNVKTDKLKLLLTTEAADAFVLMYAQMFNEGLTNLTAVSGYRNFAYQSDLFNDRIAEYKKSGYNHDKAYEMTRRYIAPAGESEHQTGLAVDLGVTWELTEEFKNTKEGIWLARNSYKYGFIIRYNKNKEHITGIAYEPWHLRYVGLPHSQIMYEKNLCLEEYLENYTAIYLPEQKKHMTDGDKENTAWFIIIVIVVFLLAVLQQPNSKKRSSNLKN